MSFQEFHRAALLTPYSFYCLSICINDLPSVVKVSNYLIIFDGDSSNVFQTILKYSNYSYVHQLQKILIHYYVEWGKVGQYRMAQNFDGVKF